MLKWLIENVAIFCAFCSVSSVYYWINSIYWARNKFTVYDILFTAKNLPEIDGIKEFCQNLEKYSVFHYF